MKEITIETFRKVFLPDDSEEETLPRIAAALAFIFGDSSRSIHDKVAGDYDFEELVGTLLSAEACILGLSAEIKRWSLTDTE